MFHVCPGCGGWSDLHVINQQPPVLICPLCGRSQSFSLSPLLVVTGASGAGKSEICRYLTGKVNECVILDTDILLMKGVDVSCGWDKYRGMWLRLVANISQSGRPVMLFGSVIPGQYEADSGRKYIGNIHYLSLICETEILTQRLCSRPTWRNSGTPEFLGSMIEFNNWFKTNAELTNPPVTLLDTSNETIESSSEQVVRWMRECLAGEAKEMEPELPIEAQLEVSSLT